MFVVSEEDFLNAVSKGEMNVVRKAIGDGIDINVRDDFLNASAIHRAIIMNNAALVNLLILHGIDCTTPNKLGASPLHMAVFCMKRKLNFKTGYEQSKKIIILLLDANDNNAYTATDIVDAINAVSTYNKLSKHDIEVLYKMTYHPDDKVRFSAIKAIIATGEIPEYAVRRFEEIKYDIATPLEIKLLFDIVVEYDECTPEPELYESVKNYISDLFSCFY